MIRVFSTGNCTKLAELRRGVDPAVVFSIAFSPSNTSLAVTSDKGTLHVFNVPHPHHAGRRSQSPAPATEEPTSQKWGILGKIPMLPRVFSDTYSVASAHFAMGNEALQERSSAQSYSPRGRPRKGVIGWLDDNTILVIGSGKEGIWERFLLRDGDDGKRYCVRDGWKRYLGA